MTISSQKGKALLPLLFAMVASIGMFIGYRIAQGDNQRPVSYQLNSTQGDVGRVEEILRFIESRYVDPVDSEKLIERATDAILDELDPHSLYITPEELNFINDRMEGAYKGLGLETIVFQDTLTIVRVIENSPASEAGLLYGDQIYMVNDSVIAGIDLDVEAMRNSLKVDSTEMLKLSIIRINGEQVEVNITADEVKLPNVSFKKLKDDIAYLNIHRFSEHTFDEVVKGLEALQKDMVIEKLILDLRDNPGGYLPEATKILNQFFVEDDRLLVFTEGIHSRKSEYKTTGRPFYKINQMTVLINGNSASASEIVAGALQDWDKAIIIGEKSYGKGLVQEQYDLSNGGALRLTIARYFTPTGRYIQVPFDHDQFNEDTVTYVSKVLKRDLFNQGGIYPDIYVKNPEQNILLDYEIEHFTADMAYEIIRKNKLYNTPENIDFADLNSNLEPYIQKIRKSIEIELADNSIPYDSRIKQLLKFRIADQLLLESWITQFQLVQDPYIVKAVETLESNTILADLDKMD